LELILAKELVIYCDESDKRGTHFSNFYGGVLIRSTDIEPVRRELAETKLALNLHRELKWSKVTSQYLEKYEGFIGKYFDLISADKLKVRIMFTKTDHEKPEGLTKYHRENEFFLLYYQFFKHAFGFQYYPEGSQSRLTRVRAYFDRLPDTVEKCEQFKDYIVGLNRWNKLGDAGLWIDRNQMDEIDSGQHDIHQGLDIILGAMAFRLNRKHRARPKGQLFRGKKTIAKEKLYKVINSRIRELHPRFNIGISTGTDGDVRNRWHHPYRHWLFVSKGGK
jgi:hypothetical protein